MRFHCGISFSWRTIKKFLLPILIGILAYFGFNFIYDNNTPLGFLKVKALENYNTRYDIDYSNVSDFVDLDIDTSHHKLIDIVNDINSNNNITREYSLFVQSTNNGGLNSLLFFIFDDSSTYSFNVYGNSNYLSSIFTTSNSKWYYKIDISTLSNNIFENSTYSSVLTCLSGGSCNSNNTFATQKSLFYSDTAISNDTDSSLYYPLSLSLSFIFYSSRDLILNNTYRTDNNYNFYKSLYVNNESIDVGSKFPTYYDLYLTPTPEPDPEPTPDPTPTPDDSTQHKALFNKIFWFDDNSTVLGVLTSIYELLFIYCLSIILLKILTMLKNMRW